MSRRPEIGNAKLYPDRPLSDQDKGGYVLQFFCPIKQTRVRRASGTRDRREAKRILRECQERLQNGKYVESHGAITVAFEQAVVRSNFHSIISPAQDKRSWQDCFDEYYRFRKERGRAKSLADSASRIEIVGRILDAKRLRQGLSANGPIQEYVSLDLFEYVQERLLAGDEGLYDSRAAMSVNTTIGAVMAFLRHCKRHSWIEDLPSLSRLSVEEVMKGRPISESEFVSMLDAVPKVVGERASASWRFVLQILWESAFRVADLMNFSFDDQTKTHPVWPTKAAQFPTIMVSSLQKNKKSQEIPMLPGLKKLLESIPPEHRHGWVANPILLDGKEKTGERTRPIPKDLAVLAHDYGNSSIGRAFGVSEAAVRKWMKKANIERDGSPRWPTDDVPPLEVAKMQQRTVEVYSLSSYPTEVRITTEHVGRIISAIGEKARIVVQQPYEANGVRVKYASAHDLRRSCAHRLINAGVSAETLKVLLRHEDFKTTERYYGAVRAAQSAAQELSEKLTSSSKQDGQIDGVEKVAQLSEAQIRKLQSFLNSI